MLDNEQEPFMYCLILCRWWFDRYHKAANGIGKILWKSLEENITDQPVKQLNVNQLKTHFKITATTKKKSTTCLIWTVACVLRYVKIQRLAIQ